ncbi:ROK family protein [Paenibacillaceae bacterium]|nr:ROK family protein [Paenibacillaceae bacterium]
MSIGKGRGPTLAKDINRKLVYHTIKKTRQTTRAEIARTLALHKNTVNSIVEELIDSGFIQELGQQSLPSAGRKPTLIRFHAGNKWAVGVQLTSTVIHWVVTDLYATPLETYSEPLLDDSPESVVAALTAGIQSLTSKYEADQCIGMGIGVPALLESERAQRIRSSHLGWSDVPLLEMLKQQIDVPLLLDNSVKLASLGELWHGSGRDLSNFVYCYFGNGIGCGLIINGAIVRGNANAAGELGHFVLDPDGPLCGCGNRGCLEAMVSLPALYRRINGESAVSASNQLSGSALIQSPEELLQAIAVGNPIVMSVMEQTGRLIGQALSYVTNLLNPTLIICDGPLIQADSVLFPVIETELQRRCLPGSTAQVALTRSRLYPFASCIGAAASVIHQWENDY